MFMLLVMQDFEFSFKLVVLLDLLPSLSYIHMITDTGT